jgi:hypothetical protein
MTNFAQSIKAKCRLLRESIEQNRLKFFPPPNMNHSNVTLNRLSYINRRFPRNRVVTGCGILRYYVSLQGQIINCNSNVISMVTYEIWKSATSIERLAYVNLSNEVNALIASKK